MTTEPQTGPDIPPPPPPSKWLYVLVIGMTAAIIVAFVAVIYGMAMTAQKL